MFKNNVEDEDEVDFCEAYKSQVLSKDIEEKSSPVVSIIIILFLLAIIIALSIFGYKYIMDSKENNIALSISGKTIDDEELKVTTEVMSSTEGNKEFKIKEPKKVIVKTLSELPQSKSVDINDLADKIKIDMSESEAQNSSLNETKQRGMPISPTILESSDEGSYVEDLAREKPLTPTVTDSRDSKYIKDLEKLTEEIDREGN